MSKAPSMPMYWDAYLADTTHLTTEEHGAYLLLLAAMWRRDGRVPDNDKDNARILGLTPAKWRKIKARFVSTISGFHVENGEITQKKLRKTWENTQENIEKNRTNGAKGGRPKSKETKDLAKANGFVSVNPNETIPEPEPEPEPIEYPPSSPPPPKARLPENWVPTETMINHARSQQISDADIMEIANDFQIYWTDRRDKTASKSERGWEQTWRNRIRDIGWKFTANRGLVGGSGTGRHGQGGSIASIAARRRLAGEI